MWPLLIDLSLITADLGVAVPVALDLASYLIVFDRDLAIVCDIKDHCSREAPRVSGPRAQSCLNLGFSSKMALKKSLTPLLRLTPPLTSLHGAIQELGRLRQRVAPRPWFPRLNLKCIQVNQRRPRMRFSPLSRDRASWGDFTQCGRLFTRYHSRAISCIVSYYYTTSTFFRRSNTSVAQRRSSPAEPLSGEPHQMMTGEFHPRVRHRTSRSPRRKP